MTYNNNQAGCKYEKNTGVLVEYKPMDISWFADLLQRFRVFLKWAQSGF